MSPHPAPRRQVFVNEQGARNPGFNIDFGAVPTGQSAVMVVLFLTALRTGVIGQQVVGNLCEKG